MITIINLNNKFLLNRLAEGISLEDFFEGINEIDFKNPIIGKRKLAAEVLSLPGR